MLKKLTLFSGAMLACSLAFAQTTCIDTLNTGVFMANPTIYTTTSGTPAVYAGYLAGTNGYGDKAKANVFPSTGQKAVNGVIMAFAVATASAGSTAQVNVTVWDATGASGAPGTALGTKSVPLTSIVQDVADSTFTYVEFTTPVMVTGNYYVGFTIPGTASAGDTVVVYNTVSPDPSQYAGWEQWSDNSWHSYSSAWGSASNPFSSSNVILPIVNNCVTGISEELSSKVVLFPNPASTKMNIAMPGLNAKQVVVMNAVGQVVQQFTPAAEAATVNVAGLSNGMYFVRIETAEGTIIKKFNVLN